MPVRGPFDDARNATLVSAGILLSRLAGLIREVVTAGFLGVGVASDAFKAALRIPNLLQNLLGEGVLSASFIPVYSRLTDDDPDEAGRTAGAVAGLLLAAVAVLVLVGVVAARPLTVVLTPGFRDDPAKLDLTVSLVRIMFPGIGLLALSAWCLAVLNAHRHFFLSYVAPVLWSAAQIVVVVAVALAGGEGTDLATALAWGVVIGGAAQFLVQVPTVRRLVPRLRLTLDRARPAVRDTISRLAPVVLGRGVVQISGYLDLLLASLLVTGAVAAGTYAQTLYLLPVSLFGMSVAAAALPELSRLRRDDGVELLRRVHHGLRRVAYFVAPTAAAYLVLGEPIVRILFQRGAFESTDTRLVWLVLATYALGLLATTGSRLLQNTLYAIDDPRTPARVALLRVVVGTAVAVAVMFVFDQYVLDGTRIRHETDVDSEGLLHLGAVGIALGSAVGAWVEYAALRTALAWRIGAVHLGGGALLPVAVSAAAAVAGGRAVLVALDGLPTPVAAVPALGIAASSYIGITALWGLPLREVLGTRPRSVRRRPPRR